MPYVPGPSSAPSARGAAVPVHPVQAERPSVSQAERSTVVGETVDLAHELAALRKLHVTNMVFAGAAMVFALLAAGLAGYVAWTLFMVTAALHDALN